MNIPVAHRGVRPTPGSPRARQDAAVTPAALCRRATGLASLRGSPSPAQLKELSEVLRHTAAALKAGSTPPALAALAASSRTLMQLEEHIVVPDRFAPAFAERFAALRNAAQMRGRLIAAAASGGPAPSKSVSRPATAELAGLERGLRGLRLGPPVR